MNKYVAVHTHKKTAQQTWEVLQASGPDLALAMEQGKTLARCLITWNPLPYGRTDMAFCLWEADKPEDVITTLGLMNEYITTDLLRVDEIAWSDLAKVAKNKAKAPA